jgi:hypothetical protein
VVGVMFWPRGAGAALGRALSDSFAASSGYLSHAVDRLTTTSHDIDTEPSQRASHRAYMRLDDAFRQYLAERGAKRVSVETVANLFTGSNRIRLAAFTMATLPPPLASQPELQSVEVARAVLRDSYAMSHRWYEDFVEVLSDKREVLDPPPVHDRTLDSVLLKAFEDVREHRRGDRLRTTLQMLWADELLEQQGQIQADLADSAALFIRPRHRVGSLGRCFAQIPQPVPSSVWTGSNIPSWNPSAARRSSSWVMDPSRWTNCWMSWNAFATSTICRILKSRSASRD